MRLRRTSKAHCTSSRPLFMRKLWARSYCNAFGCHGGAVPYRRLLADIPASSNMKLSQAIIFVVCAVLFVHRAALEVPTPGFNSLFIGHSFFRRFADVTPTGSDDKLSIARFQLENCPAIQQLRDTPFLAEKWANSSVLF